MGSKKISLVNGKVYHIFNKGNNNEVLFKEKDDFEYFLLLIEKYIYLVADIYAWVLMSNHFHFLLRIKEKEEIKYLKPLKKIIDKKEDVKWVTVSENMYDKNELLKMKKPQPIRQFSHLFNAYAKYFNKKYKRSGSLFQKSFSRKVVNSEKYFKYLVYYIHHNPVHHGFVDNMIEYPWSSFLFFPSPKDSFLNRTDVMSWFGNIDNFDDFHKANHDFDFFGMVLFK